MSPKGNNQIISLLLPTKGRRQFAERFIDSAISRSFSPELLEIVVYADKNDPTSHDLDLVDPKVSVLVGTHSNMGEMNSACLKRAKGTIVILVNDDVVILTDNWDEKIRKIHLANPDGIYLAYPNDLYKKRRMSTFPILSRRCIEIIKDPYPKDYVGSFIDTHLFDMFQRVNHNGYDRLYYLENVIFEHRHYRARKSNADRTYLAKPRYNGDATFLSLIFERSQCAERLVSAIAGEDLVLSKTKGGTYPKRLLLRLLFIFRHVALDENLPFIWRIYHAVNLMGRSVITALTQH